LDISASTLAATDRGRRYLIGHDSSANVVKENNLAIQGALGNIIDDATRRITAAEAKSRATYEAPGWDFVNTWVMVL
jgi:hypothetical protein